MDIDLLFKIAAIGILVAVLNQVLQRAGRDDQAMMTTLAGVVIVLSLVISEISEKITYTRVVAITQHGLAAKMFPVMPQLVVDVFQLRIELVFLSFFCLV